MSYKNEISDYAWDVLQRDFYTKKLNKVINSWDVRYVQDLIIALQKVIDLSSRELLSGAELEDLEQVVLFSRKNLNEDTSIKAYDAVLEQVQDALEEMHSDEEEEAA